MASLIMFASLTVWYDIVTISSLKSTRKFWEKHFNPKKTEDERTKAKKW